MPGGYLELTQRRHEDHQDRPAVTPSSEAGRATNKVGATTDIDVTACLLPGTYAAKGAAQCLPVSGHEAPVRAAAGGPACSNQQAEDLENGVCISVCVVDLVSLSAQHAHIGRLHGVL